MVGELSVSHTYISGGDSSVTPFPPNPVYTGLLGADLGSDASGYPEVRQAAGRHGLQP